MLIEVVWLDQVSVDVLLEKGARLDQLHLALARTASPRCRRASTNQRWA